MKVITSRVVGGTIQVGAELEEGTPVAILSAGEEGFHLTPEEETELESALESIREGSYVDGHALLAEIKALRRP